MCDNFSAESDREPENCAQAQLQPLLIPEIADHLAKFISTEDLLNFRLVCKIWSQEIIRQMRNRSTFSLTSTEQIENFLTNGEHFHGFKNMKLNVMECTAENSREGGPLLYNLHQKLLRRMELDFGEYLSEPFTFKELWGFAELEYLKLTRLPCALTHKSIFSESDTTHTTPFIFHKLTTLDINLCASNQCFVYFANLTGQFNHTGQFFIQLFRQMPNLEELRLSKSHDQPQSDFIMLGCIRALLSVSPASLKRLYFDFPFPKDLAIALSSSTMNIQKLYFYNLEFFTVTFDSTQFERNKIDIKALQRDYSGIHASTAINHIQEKLGVCEDDEISCTQLLGTFLSVSEKWTQWSVKRN